MREIHDPSPQEVRQAARRAQWFSPSYGNPYRPILKCDPDGRNVLVPVGHNSPAEFTTNTTWVEWVSVEDGFILDTRY